MNRRDFLNLTAGSAVAAVAPFPKMLAATPVAHAPRNLYVWAVAMARAGNPISAETLSSALKVSTAEASALINRLVVRWVVGAPNALGVARAANPVFKSTAPTPALTQSHVPKEAKTTLRNAADEASKFLSPEKTGDDAPETQPNPSDVDSGQPEALDAEHSAE